MRVTSQHCRSWNHTVSSKSHSITTAFSPYTPPAPQVVLTPSSHEHLHTHTHTSLPQTLYSSARGSHRRRCRWNTPPSPAPSAHCRRSENRTDEFARAHCNLCLTTLTNKNTPQKIVFSRSHHDCLTARLKGWKLFIMLLTLDCVCVCVPSSLSQTLEIHIVITHITIRWCSTAITVPSFKSW